MAKKTKRDTERFLRLVNEANQVIAAREAKEEQRPVELDPVRMESERIRRENGARRTSKHSHNRIGTRPAFGSVNLDP